MPDASPPHEEETLQKRRELVEETYNRFPEVKLPKLSQNLKSLVEFYNQQVKDRKLTVSLGYSLLSQDLMYMSKRASVDGRRRLARLLFEENRKMLKRALSAELSERPSLSRWLRLLHLRWHGMVSGYGTRPGRLILTMFLVVYWWGFFFIAANYLSIVGNSMLVLDTSYAFSMFSYLYFSLTNFLPLSGSTQVVPLTFGGQMLVVTEAVLGYILTAYLMELIVRRSKF